MGRARRHYKVRTPPKEPKPPPGPPPPTRRESKPGLIPDYTLYRLYDGRDRLLYVGITRDLTNRLCTHQDSKSWWPLVERVELALFSSWRAVEDAEQVAIRTENPVHNIAGRVGSGYALHLVQEQETQLPANPLIPTAREANDSPTEGHEPLVSEAAVHPDGIVVDGTSLRDITVTDVVFAGQGISNGEVLVDMRVRIRATQLHLSGLELGPRIAPVDF